jgi:hypothetical protein
MYTEIARATAESTRSPMPGRPKAMSTVASPNETSTPPSVNMPTR